MNLVRSGAIVTITSFSSSICRFAGVIALANLVPQNQLGIFFLFQATLGLLSLPAAAGINGAIEKRISEGKTAPKVLTTAVIMKAAVLSVIIPVLYILKSPVNNYVGFNAISLLIIGVITQEIAQVGYRVLRGEKRVALASIIQSFRIICWMSSAVIAAILGWGLLGLVYALVSGHMIMSILTLTIMETNFGEYSSQIAHSIINYAKFNSITSVSGMAYGWMDTAIMGIFVNPSLIAAYEVAWQLSNVGLIVSRSVALTTLPQISKLSEEGNNRRISEIVSESLVPGLIIVIPVFFGVFLLSSDILSLIYGPEYTVAAVAFIILSAERIIKSADQIFSRCLHAIDRPDLSAGASVVAIGLNLILNWILIPRYGIAGAAFGTSISFLAKAGIEYTYMQRHIPVNFPRGDILILVICAVMMSFTVTVVKTFVHFSDVYILILVVFIGGASYLCFLLLFPNMREKIISTSRSIVSSAL